MFTQLTRVAKNLFPYPSNATTSQMMYKYKLCVTCLATSSFDMSYLHRLESCPLFARLPDSTTLGYCEVLQFAASLLAMVFPYFDAFIID